MGKFICLGVASFILIFASFTEVSLVRAQDKPAMVAWEYKVIRVRQVDMETAMTAGEEALKISAKINSDAQEKFQSELAEAGKQGWELVCVAATPDELSVTPKNTALKAFLKRHLQ